MTWVLTQQRLAISQWVITLDGAKFIDKAFNGKSGMGVANRSPIANGHRTAVVFVIFNT